MADGFLYGLYERRLSARLDSSRAPRHVGVILDGNRRWAKALGIGASQGHKRGADKIEEFLGWADDAGVTVVTLWLLSTDNLSRDPSELAPLLDIIAQAVEDLAALAARGSASRPVLQAVKNPPGRPRETAADPSARSSANS